MCKLIGAVGGGQKKVEPLENKHSHLFFGHVGNFGEPVLSGRKR